MRLGQNSTVGVLAESAAREDHNGSLILRRAADSHKKEIVRAAPGEYVEFSENPRWRFHPATR